MIDTHLHLTFAPAPDVLFERARRAGLEALILQTLSLQDFKFNLDILTRLQPQLPDDSPQACLYLGAMPWYLDGPVCQELTSLLNDESGLKQVLSCCDGIGEIGLDKVSPSTMKVQQLMLDKMLDLALTYNLPVSVHVSGCHNQLLSVLKNYSGRLNGVIHGFLGSPELALAYIKLGFKLGIGGKLLQNSRKLPLAVQAAGAEHLVIETDYDNHYSEMHYDPSLLDGIVRRLGTLLGLEEQELLAILERNSRPLLGSCWNQPAIRQPAGEGSPH